MAEHQTELWLQVVATDVPHYNCCAQAVRGSLDVLALFSCADRTDRATAAQQKPSSIWVVRLAAWDGWL